MGAAEPSEWRGGWPMGEDGAKGAGRPPRLRLGRLAQVPALGLRRGAAAWARGAGRGVWGALRRGVRGAGLLAGPLLGTAPTLSWYRAARWDCCVVPRSSPGSAAIVSPHCAEEATEASRSCGRQGRDCAPPTTTTSAPLIGT